MAGEEVGPGFTAEPIVAAEDKATDTRRAELEREAPTLGAMLQDSLALMRARAAGIAKPVVMPWPGVAERLGGGLWPGLHVLTGATGQGKTQFALQAAWTAARNGTPVLYIGLELDRAGIVARLLALAEGEAAGGRYPAWSDLYLGKNKNLEELIRKHAPTLESLPFRAEFGPPHGWDFQTLGERARAMREKNPEASPGERPFLVILDFLQAVGTPEGRPMELRERIGKAAYAGRHAAKDYGAAVLLLSSTSREGAGLLAGQSGPVTEQPPSNFVGTGKESGDIEYAADSVMALCPIGVFEPGKARSMGLAVAKVRAGAPGWCELEFDGRSFQEVQTASFVVGR